MARTPEILVATIFAATGCASADTPRPTNGPVVQEVIATATAIPCVPKEFAESIGVPTPVSIGGGAASAEIVRLTDRLYRCDETLSDVEKDALRALNAEHPLLATPDPARQLVPAKTPETAPTPEPILSFPDFGVYYGKTGDGLEVLLAAKPDGTLVFTARKDNITCSNPNIKPINGLLAFPRKPGDFDFKTKSGSIIINGRLEEPDTVIGQVGNNAYNAVSDKGDIRCPATSFNYTATQIGTGRDAFVNRYLKLWNESLSPQVKQSLDSYLH